MKKNLRSALNRHNMALSQQIIPEIIGTVPIIKKTEPVIKKIERIYNYINFIPKQLAEQLNCSIKELPNTIQQYISNYPNWEKRTKKPSNYMLAVFKKRNIIYPSNVCKDLSLQLHVFGRIVGDIYIPNRTLHWSKDVFKQEYYFLEKEVFE